MTQIITIETAQHNAGSFEYATAERFPFTAKGLTLAVMAADRMARIEGSLHRHSDIKITVPGVEIEDEKFFSLLTSAALPAVLFRECKTLIDSASAA